MNSKHAYLIMAHNQFNILCTLLKSIDDERNDIFLHIDKKSKKVPWMQIRKSVNRATLFFIERQSVNWGGYSQINCEIRLLENAKKNRTYEYYHFMCGTEYPLKDQNYIHDFFRKNAGKEFLEYDEADFDYLKRIKYRYLFNEMGRLTVWNILKQIEFFIRNAYITFQKKKGTDLIKRYDYKFKKGNANWSITDNLATQILEKKGEIEKIYRYSYCADEVYLHTLVYNSPFFQEVYRENGKTSNARLTQWDREDNCYCIDDVEKLMESHALFARKFIGDEGIIAIDKINQLRNQNFQ